MAATVLGSLLVQLGMDSAQFEREATKAMGKTAQIAKTFNTTSDQVFAASQRMGVSVTSFGAQVQALQARLNPRMQAITSYRQEMGLLREAFRIGAISQEQFRAGVQRSVATYRQAGKGVVEQSHATRFGIQDLGFQLSDMATQFAGGTRAAVIFAQQGPQVVQAVQLMAGGTSRFAAFMGGPWGAGIMVGVAVLGALASKLGDTEDQLDKVKFASNEMGSAQSILGNVMDITTGKITTQNKALIALARAQILVAQIQSRTRQAEARNEIQSRTQDQFLVVRSKTFGPALTRGTPASGSTGADLLAGKIDADEAVKRLDKLRRAGQITDATFAKLAADYANFGVEAANQKVYDDAQKLLDGTGGKGLLKPGKEKKTRTPKEKEGRAQSDIDRQFNDERAQLMQQYNSILASMASSAEQAAEYELRNVELQRIRAIDTIKANKDYSAAQKQTLIAQEEDLADQQRAQIERQKTQRIEQETEDAKRQEYEGQRDRLQTLASLATTDGERQRIALELLDLDEQYKRDALERIIASGTRTDAEKALAQAALKQLDANAAATRAATIRQTETKAQAYVRDLHKTPEQINEAIDQIKIDGLESLNDGLVDALVNFRSLGDVAQSVLRQILSDLLRLQIQRMITAPLASALGLGSGLGSLLGGGGGVSAVSSLGNLSSVKLPGFASGTPFAPGGLAIVGEQGPELVNLPRGSQVIPNHDLAGMGGQQVHSPTFVFPGITDEKMAREAAGQAARRYRRELSPMRGM